MFSFFHFLKRSAKNNHAQENMKLWSMVGVTNPDDTQAAEKDGRKFTAICAQAQRQKATEIFGPYGKSWGLTPNDSKFTLITKDLILFQGVFFYTWGGHKYHFPIESSIAHSAVTKNGPKLDDECIKKVVTDAETKALSKLGFNADVFLGLFDDSRYVDDLRKEFAENGVNPTLENIKGIYQNKLVAARDLKELSKDDFDKLNKKISYVRTPAELAEIRLEMNRMIQQNRTFKPELSQLENDEVAA